MRNRLEIKSEAKSILRSAHASPLLVTAIVLVVCYVLGLPLLALLRRRLPEKLLH